ncbi:MAG: hypothetical protein IKM27_07150 [Clostridia bacterium]|nr:hypothetical protein [Clostridia bacterium]
MKKLSLLLSLLILIFSFSSCVFLPHLLFEKQESDINSSTSIEDPELSVSNASKDDGDTESGSPYEIYENALEKNNTVVSGVTDLVYSTKISHSAETESNKTTIKQKVSGYGTDNAATFISCVSDGKQDGYIYRYKDGKGYFEAGKTLLSFDCTYDELDSFAYLFLLPPDPEQGEVSILELLKDKASVEKGPDDCLTVFAKGKIASETHKKDILGSIYLSHDKVSELDAEVLAVINADGYLVSLTTKLRFTAVLENVNYVYEAENVMKLSEINQNVKIVIPFADYDYIGSYDNLDAFYAYYSLETLPAYSAKVVQEVKVQQGGFDINDIITTEANVIIGDEITLSVINDYDYVADGERYTYYTYFEDGTYYRKYLNDVYEENIGKDYYYEYTVFAWTDYCLFPECGYDYEFTDNGDGTATLSFKYKDESIALLANVYAYNNLSEDYYEMFSEPSYGSTATSTVTFNMETGALIKHVYSINASFIIDGEHVYYTESTEITINTENVTVPEKEVFLGTSAL